ncbi:hypothetical protein CVS40_1707 [Lucilia cuprina]|nr:hypothetical protein CVS40_1707 [Lucilia cuprina]
MMPPQEKTPFNLKKKPGRRRKVILELFKEEHGFSQPSGQQPSQAIAEHQPTIIRLKSVRVSMIQANPNTTNLILANLCQSENYWIKII